MTTKRTTLALVALLTSAAITTAQPNRDRPSPEDRRARLLEQQARIEAQLKQLDQPTRTRPSAADPNDTTLRDIDPAMRDRFERMKRDNPDRANTFLEKRQSRLEEMNKLRDTNPEEYRRRVETMQALRRAHQLAAEVAALEDAGKQDEANEARAKLRAEAEFVFDRTIERQQAGITKSEERLKAAKQRLEDTIANRTQRLDERVEQAIQRARNQPTEKPNRPTPRNRP